MVYIDSASGTDTGDLSEGTRVCKTCEEVRDITEFHWANGHKNRRRVCKTCMHKAQRQRIANTPESNERRRRSAYKSKLREYGLTLGQFDQMIVDQGNKCKICDKEFDYAQPGRKPHVDHCHASGKVRGVLCFVCNTGLGKFYDNPELLRSAIRYLEA